MATQTSPTTGQRYGVSRVCQIWGLARSSFYAARQQKAAVTPPAPRQRPGPKPAITDEALLAAIHADLERSPWTGEGHRKVWARLRVIDTIRVSRKRVLRLMGENTLLSPHRARTRTAMAHDGHIITQAPNQMWATDATKSPPCGTARCGCSASSSTGTPDCSVGMSPNTAPRKAKILKRPRKCQRRSKNASAGRSKSASRLMA